MLGANLSMWGLSHNIVCCFQGIVNTLFKNIFYHKDDWKPFVCDIVIDWTSFYLICLLIPILVGAWSINIVRTNRSLGDGGCLCWS